MLVFRSVAGDELKGCAHVHVRLALPIVDS